MRRNKVTSLTGFTREESRQASDLMMAFARSPQCAGPMQAAIAEVFGKFGILTEDLQIAAESESCQSVFHTWFMFDRPIVIGGDRLVDLFLREGKAGLTRGQRTYLERMKASSLRPYVVCEVERDEGLALRDLWDNSAVHVRERAATHYAQHGATLFARVIEGPDGRPEMHGLLSFARANMKELLDGLKLQHRAASEKFPELSDAEFFKAMTSHVLVNWLESFRTPPSRRRSTLQKKNEKTKTRNRIVQLKIALEGVRPQVWRRLLVPESITLPALSKTLERVMGWESYHLHEFEVAGVSYGSPDADYPSDTRNERGRKLADFDLAKGASFLYTYDFGDNWHHRIVVERFVDPQPGAVYPVCVDGRQACPPEDVGGTGGYAEFRRVLRNPKHQDYEHYRQWSRRGRRDFDPDEFDLDAANEGLPARVLVPK